MAVLEALDLNLSADKGRQVAQMVGHNWRQALYARQSFDTLVAAYWERYECASPKRELPFKQASNLRLPLTQWSVDAVLVRLMRTVFGQRPVLSIRDVNLRVPPDASDLERMVSHLSEVDLGLRAVSGHLYLNALVEGTGIAKLIRSEQRRTVRDRYGEDLIERPVVDFEGLGLEAIDLKDFVVANPAQSSIDKQPWIAHRAWLRWDDIVRRQRDGIYRITREQLGTLKGVGKRRRIAGSMPLDDTKAVLDKTEDAGWGTFDEWEIVEAIYRYDWNDDELDEECLLTVSLDYDEAPLRAESYPFWNGRRNYIAYRPLPRANRFYGRSFAGILQPMQDEQDAELAQSLDASTFTILANLTPVLPRSLKSEWEKHKWVLGKPIYVDEPSAFRSLADLVKHPIQLTQFNMATLHAASERASGVGDPQLGKTSAGSKTAYEIATVQSEGNVRFAEMIENLQLSNQELGFQIIEHAYQLSLESVSFRERMARVVGRDPFENVSMEDIRRRMAIIPTGNTITANKDLEARKWLGIWQLFNQDPFVMQDLAHRRYLAAKVLASMGAEQDVDEIIGGTEEVEQMKALIQQKAQDIQGAAAQGQIPGMSATGPQVGGVGPQGEAMPGPEGMLG